MDKVAAFLLAGGRGINFGVLSEHRPKAAFPVAGYYRIIDFALSNLSHSGVRQVGIIIQFLPASLMEHVGSGRPWDFDMADRTVRFMTPFVGVRETRWFHGTGDAVAKNINLMNLDRCSDVLILSADHVYTMDYRPLLDYHREKNADVTLACVAMPPEQQSPRFGNVIRAHDGRVVSFVEKPRRPLSPLVSIGIYCFKKDLLLELLRSCEPAGDRNEFSLSGDVLQPHIANLNAHAWIHNGPWHYLGDLEEYFDFHLRIARGELDLFNDGWNVMTNFADRALGSRTPARFLPGAVVHDSIISPGCTIAGTVEGSVLSPGVYVGPNAVVRDSMVMHDARISEGARLRRALIDKDVVIEAGVVIEPAASEGPTAVRTVAKGALVREGETVTRVGAPG